MRFQFLSIINLREVIIIIDVLILTSLKRSMTCTCTFCIPTAEAIVVECNNSGIYICGYSKLFFLLYECLKKLCLYSLFISVCIYMTALGVLCCFALLFV